MRVIKIWIFFPSLWLSEFCIFQSCDTSCDFTLRCDFMSHVPLMSKKISKTKTARQFYLFIDIWVFRRKENESVIKIDFSLWQFPKAFWFCIIPNQTSMSCVTSLTKIFFFLAADLCEWKYTVWYSPDNIILAFQSLTRSKASVHHLFPLRIIDSI